MFFIWYFKREKLKFKNKKWVSYFLVVVWYEEGEK